jgi:hypothetical protein
MAIHVDLNELERRLGARTPRAYREFVEREPPKSLIRRGFDPKTLLVLNLELRETDREGYTRGRFFLNTDGCGNYYFVKLGPSARTVLLWSHDPLGIEKTGQALAAYLREATQEFRIGRPVPRGELCICRTSAPDESVLDPIPLESWIAAVNSTDGVEYLGYREGTNPFTGEVVRFEMPGFTRVLGAKNPNHYISFRCGRAEMPSRLRPLAQTLARKLRANLLPKRKRA